MRTTRSKPRRPAGLGRKALSALLGALFLAGSIGRAAAADDKPIDLLRLPAAKVEQTTALGGDAAQLRALTDGDPATTATVAASADVPLDVVYGFGEALVSPEGIRVALPGKAGPGTLPASVEILVSTVSPNAGFRSLRVDPLAASPKPQTFSFQPTAARWILLRFTAAPKSTQVAVATVEVLGREGPPASRYAFSESRAKAFSVLARLEKSSSLKIAISPDEAALFAKARAGPLDPAAFADAALLASGVLDPARRRTYLARIDDLERTVRQALATKQGTQAQGEALLKWLHQGPMAKGYVAGQTNLSAIFDTGTFNCVSSATLFNVLALRLGRLTPAFAEQLRSWSKSGFSVFVGDPIEAQEPQSLLRVSRYLVRPAIAYRRVVRRPGGGVRILSSSPSRPDADLDPLEASHRLLLHVPAKGQHQVRYYGAYANRTRARYRPPEPGVDEAPDEGPSAGAWIDRDDVFAVARLLSWARLLARLFELDPLRCPRCGEGMRVVGFVTQAAVIDKILQHRKAKQLTSPFESRAPPAA